jgi:hypothetical protein
MLVVLLMLMPVLLILKVTSIEHLGLLQLPMLMLN